MFGEGQAEKQDTYGPDERRDEHGIETVFWLSTTAVRFGDVVGDYVN
jgi:hypothetical protein